MNFELNSSVLLPDQHIREQLKTKTVGIAGCGGLGSNCAVALARVGVGKLILADFDVIETSNLNRQYFFGSQVGMPKVMALAENIKKIDEGIVIDAHHLYLSAENIPILFQDCDVIVEAFDTAEMKQMIIETVLEMMPGKKLVCGVGLAGWGDNDIIKMRAHDYLYICGDLENEVTELFPPLAPRVGIVAHMEANQVLEILLGKMKTWKSF
ncbi:MAG: sulfur carrier protein ThiS adenylyltransferase ThiF [Bacteroidales bacterium]|nr:sulfur carrier protein ThiS adenylyltransferase ThiF [Bacteroidales bacterium]